MQFNGQLVHSVNFENVWVRNSFKQFKFHLIGLFHFYKQSNNKEIKIHEYKEAEKIYIYNV